MIKYIIPSQDNIPTLSICMIVKNEEENLIDLLPELSEADELIIVDTGSDDNSVGIAKQFTDKVFFYNWNDDFASARNVGLENATKDYIMWLDADDRIPSGFIKQLKFHLYSSKGTAVWTKLVNKKPTGDVVSFQIRVVPNNPNIRFEGAVHEQLAFSIEKEKIPYSHTTLPIYHFGYYDESKLKDKLKRNLIILLDSFNKETDDIKKFFWLVFISKSFFELGYALPSLYYSKAAFNYLKTLDKMSEEWVISLYTVAASAYANIHNISKAQEILEECRDKYPDNRTIRYVLGQLYMSLHKYKDAYLELSIFLDNKIKIEGLPISIDLMRENIQTGLLISSLYVGDFNVADTILKTLTNDVNYKIRRPNELFKFKED